VKIKIVNRYSQQEKLCRVFRVMWDGKYPTVPSRKLTFALALRKNRWLPGLFRIRTDELYHWRWHLVLVPFLVIRIHFAESHGGQFV
jgi:hypothetical protein